MGGKNKTQNIVSLSGGKDSTAMLLMMLERGEPIEAIVFFETGWEFPQILNHIDRLEKDIGQKIWRLYPREPYDFLMAYHPTRAKAGPQKGKIHRIGYGWPGPIAGRWCTSRKTQEIDNFAKRYETPVQCVGLAFDEKKRIKNNSLYEIRYPLIEWGVTDAEALQYCYNRRYAWDGLYMLFSRVGCYCCPFQRKGELRNLRKYFPELWQRMIEMDKLNPNHNVGFGKYGSVINLDEMFAKEDEKGV